ncbi:unnamed protein product [Rodentolepis nana]|uniref:Anaphase-promoting complex subunit 10 n=1 Tax=Rodentolepis nana TaxID=102285 RepID=A0A0R3TD00_RODNA|nr:unnamed protein product [Rodentolepis nana]
MHGPPETVDSGTLPIRREFKISRCNELKPRTKEKQWTVALSDIADYENRSREIVDSGTLRHTRLARIEAVAEFRLRIGHSYKGETVDSGTLPIRREFKISRCNELKPRTKEKQWTVALSDIADYENRSHWEYTLNPYALRNLQEEMEKTHLTR